MNDIYFLDRVLRILTVMAISAFASFGCSEKDSASSGDGTTSEDSEGAADGIEKTAAEQDSDNDVAKQPDNVAGGFGLYMECSLMSRDGAEATSATVGCNLKADDGEDFRGTITDVAADVFTATGEKAVTGTVTPGNAGGVYDFYVSIAGGASVISVVAHFKADGKAVVLTAPVYSVQEKTAADMTLYVSPVGGESVICAKVAPCRKLSQAVGKLPERINHRVEIVVAEATYLESVTIKNFSFGQNGEILIRGAGADLSGKGTFTVNSSGLDAHAMELSNLPGTTKITDAVLTAGTLVAKNALNIGSSTAVYLKNVALLQSFVGAQIRSSTVYLGGSIRAEGNSVEGWGVGIRLTEGTNLYARINEEPAVISVANNGTGGIVLIDSNFDFQGKSISVTESTSIPLQILNRSTFTATAFESITLDAGKEAALRIANDSAARFARKNQTGLMKLDFRRRSSTKPVIEVTGDSELGIGASALQMSIVQDVPGSQVVKLDIGGIIIISAPATCEPCAGGISVGFQSGIVQEHGTLRQTYGETTELPKLNAKEIFESREWPMP